VRDFQLYLTEISDSKNEPWVKDNINETLSLLAKNPKFHEARYVESTGNFDPFKKRVLTGISKGLTMASVENSIIFEQDQYNQNE
jgi:hypothetical protein